MAETAAQKKARLAKEANVVPAFNPNTKPKADKQLQYGARMERLTHKIRVMYITS